MATNWTAGDRLANLTGTCKNRDTPVDLTASTAVVAHIKRPDDTLINRAATREAGVGEWSLAWAADDLNDAGTYVVEIEVTWDGGLPQTFGGGSFSVARQLA